VKREDYLQTESRITRIIDLLADANAIYDELSEEAKNAIDIHEEHTGRVPFYAGLRIMLKEALIIQSEAGEKLDEHDGR